MPPDYVNWVRLSLYKDGLLMPLTENIQTNWSDAYLQDNNCRILFDHEGNILKPSTSTIDMQRILNEKNTIASNSNHGDYLWLWIILVILALLKE